MIHVFESEEEPGTLIFHIESEVGNKGYYYTRISINKYYLSGREVNPWFHLYWLVKIFRRRLQKERKD